jgi:hypothetical protein
MENLKGRDHFGDQAQNRVQWQALVNIVMNLQVS